MAKHLIMLAAPCGGSYRQEVGNLMVEAALVCQGDPRIEDLIRYPIKAVPTPVARNKIVAKAKKIGVDILFMIDSDMRVPEDAFKAMLDFLLDHQGPAVIGLPYCTEPPVEKVLVFEWGTTESSAPDHHWAIAEVCREDACRRTGIEQIANIGTGFIGYRMEAFNRVKPPYYDYSYDGNHEEVVETEDCYCHRRMHFAKVPVYCHWDFWANHYKTKRVEKPQRVLDANMENMFMAQARAELRMQHRLAKEMVPEDVEGWCDFADVYSDAVQECPDGGHLIEVGAWKGKSAILMARLIEKSGKKLRFTIVDNFQGSAEHKASDGLNDLRETFERNFADTGLRQLVSVSPMDSLTAAEQTPDKSANFIFLDGSHTYEDAKADIHAWLPKLRAGGTLAGHDFWIPSVNKAVTEEFGENIEVRDKTWIVRAPWQDGSRPSRLVAAQRNGD